MRIWLFLFSLAWSTVWASDSLWMKVLIRDFPNTAPHVQRYDAALDTPRCGGRIMRYGDSTPVYFGQVKQPKGEIREGYLKDIRTSESQLIFRIPVEVTPGMVKSELNSLGRPVKNEDRCYNDNFYQWFSDSLYKPVKDSLLFLRVPGHDYLYEFRSPEEGFFPLDKYTPEDTANPNFGKQDLAYWCNPKKPAHPDCEKPFSPSHPKAHNFGFSVEGQIPFTYTGGETFVFSGDDDMWVFVDGLLEIDLGGIHLPAFDTLFLDELARRYDWKPASNHTLHFFYVERQSGFSSLRITTSLKWIPENQFLVYAHAGVGGSTEPRLDNYVSKGDSLRISIKADPEFKVQQVYVNGLPQGPLSAFTFYNINQHHSLSVHFDSLKKHQYIVNAEAGVSGRIEPDGIQHLNHGESVQFNIIPDEGYEVAELSLDGSTLTPENFIKISPVTSDHNIRVTFKPAAFKKVSFYVEHNEGGTVSPGGSMELPVGSRLPITVEPEPGYYTKNIILNDDTLSVQGSFILEELWKNTLLKVIFDSLRVYEVKIRNYSGGYSIPQGVNRVFAGESLQVQVIPYDNYLVDTVKVDGKYWGPVENFTLYNIKKDHLLEITYKPAQSDKILIKTQKSGGGRILPSGNIEVTPGSRMVFYLKPDPGYKINKVLVNGSPQKNDAIVVFESIEIPVVLQVEFSTK